MLDVVPPSGKKANQPASKRYVPVGPRTVSLDWKLPARLRKPVSKNPKQAGVVADQTGFTRKKLYAQDVAPKRIKSLRIPTPPYMGNFSKPTAIAPPPSKKARAQSVPVARSKAAAYKDLTALGLGERDAAYAWPEAAKARSIHQREELAVPVRVGWWPFSKKKLKARLP